MLRRLGHDVSDDAVFFDGREKAVAKASVGQLLVPEFRRDTLALCGSFFFCLLSVYMGTNWVPRMLTRTGFEVGIASWGLTAFNFGGVVGAIIGALVIMRLGSRLSMLTMAAGAVLGAVVLSVMAIGPQAGVLVFVMLAWTGGLINAVQTTMYALAAHVYPDIDSGHGRRHGRRLRANRRRHQPDARGMGPRHRWAGEVLRYHRGHHDAGARLARGGSAPCSRSRRRSDGARRRRGAGQALAVGLVGSTGQRGW